MVDAQLVKQEEDLSEKREPEPDGEAKRGGEGGRGEAHPGTFLKSDHTTKSHSTDLV